MAYTGSEDDFWRVIIDTAISLISGLKYANWPASPALEQYVQSELHNNQQLRQLGRDIADATKPWVYELFCQMHNGYRDYDLKQHRCSVNTRNQVVYIDVLTRQESGSVAEFWQYVGCAHGQRGVIIRIKQNHLSAAYRARNPTRHYTVMGFPSMKPNILLLYEWLERVLMGKVILAEAVFVYIFGSYQSDLYLARRPSELPPPPPEETAVNRTSPFLSDD